MNRKKLLRWLAGQGFKADGDPTLDAVKAFLDSNGITLTDADGKEIDIVKAWSDTGEDAPESDSSAKSADADVVTVSRKELDELRAMHKEALRALRGSRQDAINGASEPPQTFLIGNAERKAFNAKAARGETNLPDADTAEVIGAWFKLLGSGPFDFDGKRECVAICRKANVSYDFTSGGWVIPQILSSTLISIRPRYSALEQLMPIAPIAPQGEAVPRRTGGVTVYSPSEGVAATESNPAGDQVKLTPFEMVALTTVSKTQLMRSNIDFGEFVVGEMSYALAKKLEEIFVLGDGTSTYFNQVGLLGKAQKQVTDAGGTWSTNAEYHSASVRAAGNLWSEITYADTTEVLARGAAMVEGGSSLAWLCHPAFWHSTLLPLARNRGGATTAEVVNGQPVYRYEGYPVVFSNAMPSTSANGSVCLWFGDFATCTKVGVVPGSIMIESNPHRYWDQRKIGYQASVYYAVNCHDIGSANSTKPAQTVPMAFLITAES